MKLLPSSKKASDVVPPEAVSFDGTANSEWLSRSSDLSGNLDSKTFTISLWVYPTDNGLDTYLYTCGSSNSYTVRIKSNGSIHMFANNGSVLNATTGIGLVPDYTWTHIMFSIDMANTSARYIYVNDVNVTSGTTWTTYTNTAIPFTQSLHSIFGNDQGGDPLEGRAAQFFLDYTYRDLSVESNRRLFIDSDGKPSADQALLNPILYLPLKDASSAGINEGTGGDFTANGVLDTASRGPNQNNCAAIEFISGNNFFVKSSGITGIPTSSTLITFSAIINKTGTSGRTVCTISEGSSYRLKVISEINGDVTFLAVNSSGIVIVEVLTSIANPEGRNFHFALSFDLSDSGKRHLFINGVEDSPTWLKYNTAETIDFDSVSLVRIGLAESGSGYFTGSIGELYFNTTYIDLSSDNPFWDKAANRPKPVRQNISETGTTPLLALPLSGGDIGDNLGSGGDFTSSGSFSGARGGSEFWARSADFDSGKYLGRTSALTGISDGKQITVCFAVNFTNVAYSAPFGLGNATGTDILQFTTSSSGIFEFASYAENSSGVSIDVVKGESITLSTSKWYVVLFSVDSSNTSKRHFYVDGVDNTTWGQYNNSNFALDSPKIEIGKKPDLTNPLRGDLGFLYFNNSYIDFSQESNRNLFVDQLGYPKDLTPAIDAGDIPEPLIYMKFDDTSNLGTNSGTGGDFTVNGTVTAGADVDPNA